MDYFKVFVYFLASITWSFVLCRDKPRTRFKPDKDGPPSERQSLYIRGLQCNASDKYVYPNYTCFPKSWSRPVSTMNIDLTFRMPLIEFLMEAKIFYKYGTIYREVIHTPMVEWCKLMKDYLEPKFPSPLSFIIQLMRDSTPEVVHQCPYTELNYRNRTANISAAKSLFPAGEYKPIFYLYAGNNETIGAINILGEMISPLKESFG